MRRDKLDFYGRVPTLRDLYWHADIIGPKQRLAPCLAHALEVAYCTGALDALGCAQGYPDDDVRLRCLALQRQAAQRMAELREARNDYGTNTPANRANRTVKRRSNARSDYRYR